MEYREGDLPVGRDASGNPRTQNANSKSGGLRAVVFVLASLLTPETSARIFSSAASHFWCQWLEKGGSLAALQDLMGHASIVTTQRYARLSDNMVEREVERIAARYREER